MFHPLRSGKSVNRKKGAIGIKALFVYEALESMNHLALKQRILQTHLTGRQEELSSRS